MKDYFKESLKQNKKKAKQISVEIETLNKDLKLTKQQIKESKFLYFLSKMATINKSIIEISVSQTREAREYSQWHTCETIKSIGGKQTTVIIIKNGIEKQFIVSIFNQKEKKEIQSFIDT